MNITFYNDQKALTISFSFVQELAHSVFKTLGQGEPDEIIIHLIDKVSIAKLHGDFFDDPTPTDCISFPLDDFKEKDPSGYQLLGEIFVCPEVAIDYSLEHGTDPLREVALYIIHGILHLVGFDDIEENDRKKMQILEQKCMQNYFSTITNL